MSELDCSGCGGECHADCDEMRSPPATGEAGKRQLQLETALVRIADLEKELADIKKRRCWTCRYAIERIDYFHCASAELANFESIVSKWGSMCGCEQWKEK